jgi:uncharacterized glyoxalase superfamily protein PhnB
MRFNRSVPPCAVIPVLVYPDPAVAADWLSKAFGFTVRLRIANHRIQMMAGEGCFTIAEGDVAPNDSHIIQVRIKGFGGTGALARTLQKCSKTSLGPCATRPLRTGLHAGSDSVP